MPQGTKSPKAEGAPTMKHTFYIGQPVKNLGIIEAIVDGFHPVTGDLILKGADGTKWIADPAKCEPAAVGWMHKDGLIALC